MGGIFKTILPVFALMAVSTSLLQCKQPYNSPYVSPTTGYLVVEGYISGNTPTSFMLSRTIKLSSDTTNPQELGASMQVEGDDNSVYPLIEQGGGVYNTPVSLPLNTTANYRIRIHTQSGGEYLSDYVPYKITPVIDSINWVENGNGVTIYANAHNDAGTTRYYQWSYGETWEYNSAEESELEYVPVEVVSRPPADEIYRCWHGDSSTNILISSTAKLARDVVYEYPLRQIPINTVPLSVMYSILVRQYALTEGGYDFLSLMQKNTESLGTIFDAQPSELTGNVHCLTKPSESVIGFVSAGTVTDQRIFINRGDLPKWYYTFTCPMKDTPLPASPDQLKDNYFYGPFTPLYSDPMKGIYSNYTYCIDCTEQGGSNIQPVFWPN